MFDGLAQLIQIFFFVFFISFFLRIGFFSFIFPFLIIFFKFSLLILNFFLFSYQTFMTRISGLTGYPANLYFFSFSSLVFFLPIGFFSFNPVSFFFLSAFLLFLCLWLQSTVKRLMSFVCFFFSFLINFFCLI